MGQIAEPVCRGDPELRRIVQARPKTVPCNSRCATSAFQCGIEFHTRPRVQIDAAEPKRSAWRRHMRAGDRAIRHLSRKALQEEFGVKFPGTQLLNTVRTVST